MPTCRDVANYFLAKVNPEFGDLISNLKLQKLTYYAQGFSLAMLGEPLFDEPIEAWEHGPVVPELYRAYREHGANPIPPVDSALVDGVFTEDQLDVLEQVYAVYGQFSAWKLRNMTHEEKPWLDAIDGDRVISHEAMEEFFETLVDD